MQLYKTFRSAKWRFTGHPGDSYSGLLSRSQGWLRPQLEDYRNSKLRTLIAHCYHHVPYYRNLMTKHGLSPDTIQSAEDLWMFPVLTKKDIRKNSQHLIATNASKMNVRWVKTGGTTGEPMRILKDLNCSAWENMCFERGLCWGGLGVHEPRIQLVGGSLGLEKSPGITKRLGNMLRNDLFLPAFELTRKTAHTYFDRIERSGCRFILGYASSLYQLAEFAREFKRHVSFVSVFSTAELILPEWKIIIEETFKCQVLPYYGCGEVNSLGFTGKDDTSYIIPEEHAIVEAGQENGVSKLTGEGHFLITNLDNFAMPTIRYEVGDSGLITQAEGKYPFNQIKKLHGRSNSFLISDAGDQISPSLVPHVFRNFFSVESYQVVQEELLHIVITIVPKRDFCNQDKNDILNVFQGLFGKRMVISFKLVDSIPRPPSGKFVFVVNRCV